MVIVVDIVNPLATRSWCAPHRHPIPPTRPLVRTLPSGAQKMFQRVGIEIPGACRVSYWWYTVRRSVVVVRASLVSAICVIVPTHPIGLTSRQARLPLSTHGSSRPPISSSSSWPPGEMASHLTTTAQSGKRRFCYCGVHVKLCKRNTYSPVPTPIPRAQSGAQH